MAAGTQDGSWPTGAAALARRVRPAGVPGRAMWGRPECTQVLERDDGGLGSRPARSPGGHCRKKLPSPQLFRRELRGAARWQRDVQQAAQAESACSAGSKPSKTNVSSRSARRCSAGASRPNRCRPHSAIGCSGVFLQKLRGAPFDPGMRTFREPRVELLDEPRLTEGQFANDLDELALTPRSGALPTPRKQAQFLFAADERRQGSRAASPPAAASRGRREELNRARLRL